MARGVLDGADRSMGMSKKSEAGAMTTLPTATDGSVVIA